MADVCCCSFDVELVAGVAMRCDGSDNDDDDDMRKGTTCAAVTRMQKRGERRRNASTPHRRARDGLVMQTGAALLPLFRGAGSVLSWPWPRANLRQMGMRVARGGDGIAFHRWRLSMAFMSRVTPENVAIRLLWKDLPGQALGQQSHRNDRRLEATATGQVDRRRGHLLISRHLHQTRLLASLSRLLLCNSLRRRVVVVSLSDNPSRSRIVPGAGTTLHACMHTGLHFQPAGTNGTNGTNQTIAKPQSSDHSCPMDLNLPCPAYLVLRG